MAIDTIKVNETINFAMNDYDTYKRLIDTYLPNLQKKVNAGKYDHEKAIKLLEYHYSNYARPEMKKRQKYGFDPKLNPQERKEYGIYMRDYLFGEYLEPMIKKYKSKQTLKDNKKAKVKLLKYNKNKK